MHPMGHDDLIKHANSIHLLSERRLPSTWSHLQGKQGNQPPPWLHEVQRWIRRSKISTPMTWMFEASIRALNVEESKSWQKK